MTSMDFQGCTGQYPLIVTKAGLQPSPGFIDCLTAKCTRQRVNSGSLQEYQLSWKKTLLRESERTVSVLLDRHHNEYMLTVTPLVDNRTLSPPQFEAVCWYVLSFLVESGVCFLVPRLRLTMQTMTQQCVLSQAVTGSVESLLQRGTVTPDEVCHILFQLLFGLGQYQRLVKFCHGGLSLQNIMYEKLSVPKCLTFYLTSNRRFYQFHTRYLVRLTDFRQSTLDYVQSTIRGLPAFHGGALGRHARDGSDLADVCELLTPYLSTDDDPALELLLEHSNEPAAILIDQYMSRYEVTTHGNHLFYML